MASRRTSTVPSGVKNAAADSKSKSANNGGKTNSGAPGKKQVKTSGTIVKSRYMQSAEKSSLSKSNSLTNESVSVPPRPSSPKPSSVRPKLCTPPRRSVAPSSLASGEPSFLGKSVLQSTFSDGQCFRPNFDISVIKEKTVVENAAEPERNPEVDKRIIEMQTFLLAYLTAKMESNTAKLKAEAETRLMQEMEEEEALHNEFHGKMRQYVLMEKEKIINELLDIQISALTPVAEAAKNFTKEYKTFGTAVDITRHELPVKNVYIEGDRGEFLDKAEACLKESETLLLECTQGDHQENSTSLECLRNMKTASQDISQQLLRAFSGLRDLSSLVCRHTILVQQGAEEEQLGATRGHELYCPKQ
ncbi:HAUS augmin-like complex subunit 8 isoform X2 [Genypterus blacodes]|uniref:HAUS augmin-like complex subunit 8 isoform X2 n=1 Tax=Genypterus blacodes TaxID=154954 RepID=UPI003F76D476